MMGVTQVNWLKKAPKGC